MKISRENLVKALETVKPGLSNKEIIEQSSSFCFIEGNVVTFNDEISIRCPVEGIEFTGAINSTEFYQLLLKLKVDEVNLELLENELIVKCGKIKAGIRLQSEITLPIDEIGKISKWKPLPKNFIKAIHFAMGCCSKDMIKPILTCVHLKDSIAESTDNFRMLQYTMTSSMPVNEVLLPANICATLVKMKPSFIAEGEGGWIHFKTKEEVVISCRFFEEKFPDLKSILKVSGKEITFPVQISDILERANVFSQRDHITDEYINISIEDNRILIKAKNEQGSWFEEKAKMDYEDTPLAFMITPYLLKDILLETNKCFFKDNKLSFAGEDWKFLTLIRG